MDTCILVSHKEFQQFVVLNQVLDLRSSCVLILSLLFNLGHAFSLSKAEFMTRFQRQIGKNAQFPFAFHCTGMPISSSAIRLQREIDSGNTRSEQPTDEQRKKAPKDTKWPSLTQYEILMKLDIAEEEIPKFTDPNYWLNYFPPLGMEDLKRLGIHTDWRRSFITTSKNPYYDQFVRW